MFARLRSLFRLLFVWKVSETKPDELEKTPPDCIIVLAFGQGEESVGLGAGLSTSRVVPGLANELIAGTLSSFLSYTGIGMKNTPILAQWEFTETRHFRQGHNLRSMKETIPLGKRHEYWNTREILAKAKDIMDEHGWKTALIVAHPWHLARCTWTAEKLGIRTIYSPTLVEDLKYNANVWNKNIAVPPKQIQTTSLKHWLWYEFRARGYFWYKGWI